MFGYLKVPLECTKRVVILTDAKNEADDQYAIAHALLSPSLEVRAVVASHFVRPGTMELSYREAVKVVGLAGLNVPVIRGHDGALTPERDDLSPGAQALLEESLREDPRPLYVLCMGPLTELAEALRADASLAERMTLVWVGGASYPEGGREANLCHDVVAAQEVFASAVPIWQVTSRAYRTLAVPLSQLYARVRPAGELGAYLYEELIEFSESHMAEKPWILPECWALGDNSSVGLLLCPQDEGAVWCNRPVIGKDGVYVGVNEALPQVKVYESLNTRLILDDLFYKLERFAQQKPAEATK